MYRKGFSFLFAVACALALAGCPRRTGMTEEDGGPPPPPDAGYDPATGNRFEGPLSLDDERVRRLDPAGLRAGSAPCREPILARVYRVVDGDTVWVRGESAVLDTPLRLIGVDTPEVASSTQSAQCYGDDARIFTRLLQDRLVWLTFDADCFDPFDRLLAYVHVGAGEGDIWQRQLLRRGFGRVLTIGGNRTYSGVFTADQDFANMSGVGLWSACF